MKLTLEQKLALSRRHNCLTLFDSTLFVKAYNESAYILSRTVGKRLNPIVYRMKYPPFSTVIIVGFPYLKLRDYFPNLIKTEFGYELKGQFDLSVYSEWLMANETYSGTPL